MTGSGRLLCRKLLLDYERVLIILSTIIINYKEKNPVHCLVEVPNTLWFVTGAIFIMNSEYYRRLILIIKKNDNMVGYIEKPKEKNVELTFS